MTQDTVQSIEASIKQAKPAIELAKALERLESNKDFKTVIGEGYLEKEAVRLVHLKANPAMQTVAHQAAVMLQIDGIGALLQYFRTVNQLAAMAAHSIEQDELALEELATEEAERG